MGTFLIHYFSGTGNTNNMVKVIEDELKRNNHKVDSINMENEKSLRLYNYDEYSIHIICFPVYGFGAPAITLKYISKLKVNKKSKAVILCTSAGFEGQSLSHSKLILKRNGFDVIYTDMITYTYNWTQVFNPPTKEVEEIVFKKAEEQTREIIQKILVNKTKFRKLNFIALSLSWFVFIIFTYVARRILGKTYVADANCINCGLCKEVCPTRTIDMKMGKPQWKWSCELCQRCINSCPRRSIQLSIFKLMIHIVAEIIPILLLILFNHRVTHLSIIINILIYFVLLILNTFLADIIINYLSRINIFHKIFEISYTKRYRRNIANGFNLK